jgi:hypothetical protein
VQPSFKFQFHCCGHPQAHVPVSTTTFLADILHFCALDLTLQLVEALCYKLEGRGLIPDGVTGIFH